MTHAAVCSLESYSPEEESLTFFPKRSYFHNEFHQCHKFVKQMTKLETFGTVQFGHQLSIPLDKNDMIGRVYIAITVPAIRHKDEARSSYTDSKHHRFDDDGYDCSRSSSSSSRSSSSSSSSSSSRKREYFNPKKHYVTWVNSLAHVIIETLEMQVSGVTINTHSGEYMDNRDYITGVAGQTDEIVGRHTHEEDLWRASRREQVLVARVRFDFCESISKSLPVFSIYKSTVGLVLKLRPLKECYYSSDNSVPWRMDSGREICTSDVGIEIVANVYHLTRAERSRIYVEDQTHLMHQVQEMEVPFTVEDHCREPRVDIELTAKHPVAQMWWVIQKDDHLLDKMWFTYEDENGEDPLDKVMITIGGKPMFPRWYGKWFRTVENIEHRKTTLKKHIYVMHFALYPDDDTFHSGYMNFTANKHIVMHLTLKRGLGKCYFKAWFDTINLFRVDRGGVGVGWL